MTPQDEMRHIFFESAEELLQKLNDEALRLEANPLDREAVREIRRVVHTIKGDSAVLGFGEIAELAHELEDVLAPESLAGEAGLAEVVLSAADMFDAMLAAYRGGFPTPSGDPLRSMMWKLAQQRAAATAPAAIQPEFAWPEAQRCAIEEAITRRLAVFNVAFTFAPDCPMRAAGAEMLRKALEACGEILASAPEPPNWPDTDCIETALATSLDEESLSAKLFVPGITANLIVQRWSDDAGTVAEDSHPPQPHARRTDENLLRVDAEKIDALLNLVGELVVGKSMLQQAITDFSRRHPKDPLRSQFADALALQSQTLRALHRAAMGIRMVPVEQLFRRFPRMVRDVARHCGKQVELESCGQETELDKALVDALAEPLGHLVRNAVDHGIESPAERRAAGKPEAGVVRLNAFHEGNQMVIEVSDDGRGIDRDAVVRRAVERGIVSAEQADRLDTTDITDFIFEAGFSTANHVTSISGRGVGMDIVKAALQKLKGTATITSTPGKGCTVRLKMPLTLAIMRSMLFRIGENVYAVPLDAVAEIRRALHHEFVRAGNREALQVRNELVTVLRLQRMPGEPPAASDRTFVLVLNAGQRKFALTVDAVIAEQELVIKPLDDKSISSTLVSGASILGDGTVAMVLNLDEAIRRYAMAPTLPAPAPTSDWRPRA